MSEATRAVWLVRAGSHGEDEDLALTEGRAIIGFQGVADLTKATTIEAVYAELRKAEPSASGNRMGNLARQLWSFRSGMASGDLVVLPLKTRPGQIALGRVSGPYQFHTLADGPRHTRPVKWMRPDLARTAFGQDLLNSFGAFLTVCRITRHAAESRVAAVLDGKPDPGWAEETEGAETAPAPQTDESAVIDISQAAHDEITAFVRKRFPAHDLARLVEAVIQAEGFQTFRSPPGPDKGVDILAAMGPLGLDAPSLCVQVKATEAAADVNVFRALQGTMQTFGASQGLLVCWGGFTQSVKSEARQHTFKIRLWDQSDLVQAIYRTYERLSPEIQAELPLKRVWVLVREDAEVDE